LSALTWFPCLFSFTSGECGIVGISGLGVLAQLVYVVDPWLSWLGFNTEKLQVEVKFRMLSVADTRCMAFVSTNNWICQRGKDIVYITTVGIRPHL